MTDRQTDRLHCTYTSDLTGDFFILCKCYSFNYLIFFSGTLRWKENLAQKAAAAFLQRQQDTPNLQKLVYGNGEILSVFWYTCLDCTVSLAGVQHQALITGMLFSICLVSIFIYVSTRFILSCCLEIVFSHTYSICIIMVKWNKS